MHVTYSKSRLASGYRLRVECVLDPWPVTCDLLETPITAAIMLRNRILLRCAAEHPELRRFHGRWLHTTRRDFCTAVVRAISDQSTRRAGCPPDGRPGGALHVQSACRRWQLQFRPLQTPPRYTPWSCSIVRIWGRVWSPIVLNNSTNAHVRGLV